MENSNVRMDRASEIRELERILLTTRLKLRELTGEEPDCGYLQEAQEQLRDSENKLREFADNVPDVFWTSSPDMQTLDYLSPAYESVWGRSCASLLANPTVWTNTILEEDRQQVVDAFSKLTEYGTDVDVEFRISRPDGSVRWIRSRAFRVVSEAGVVQRISGIASDITASKLAEQAAERQRTELGVLFDLMPAMIWFKDTKNNHVRVNQRAAEAAGLPRDQIEGRPAAHIYPDEAEKFYRDDLIVIESKEPKLNIVEKITQPDGTSNWLRTDKVPYFDQSGNVIGIVVMAQDVTEQYRAEAALRESEERFAGAFEYASIGMALVLPDGKWLKVNKAFCEMLGYSEAELFAKSIDEITHPEDILASKDNVSRARQGEMRSFQLEKRYIHKTGRVINVLLSISLLRDEQGEPLYFVSQVQDITEAKQIERALRESEEKFRHLADSVSDVFFVNSADMRTVHYISPAYSQVFGYSVESLYADPAQWFESIIDEDRPAAGEVMGRILAGETNVTSEFRIRRSDGVIRWIHGRAFQVRDVSGEVIRIAGIASDVTERKEIEASLRASEERFREMLENVELLAMTLDLQGNVTFCNDYLLRLTGYAREEILGQELFPKLAPLGQVDVRRKAYRTIWSAGVPHSQEFTVRTKNGDLLEIVWNITMLRDHRGNVTGVASIGEDITDRKRAALALQQALADTELRVEERTSDLALANRELKLAIEQADAANMAKSRFLSRMSHEFRTPMNAILGFGQLLELSELDEMQADNLHQILKGGRHLLGLINDVLEISRIETGSLGISLERVDLAQVLSESGSLMKATASERGITLMVEEMTPTYVVADRQRLRQVILNLVSNGIKYNVKSGSVVVRTKASGSGFISIEVADTGIGISPCMQEKLFQPFERLGAEGSGIEGTGLGLSLSKSLTEAMGGTLTYESCEGSGSTFRVRLSLSAPEEKEALLAKVSAIRPLESGEAPLSILVIEDNLTNIELLRRLFASQPNIKFDVAMNGIAGLEQANSRRPDVILLDLHLPDMNGRQVLIAMKGDPVLKDIPVIIISADAFSKQTDSLLSAGAFRYITKPFVLEELMLALEAALGQAASSRQAA